MDKEKLLQEYFEKNTLMQLATVAGGKPWLCNVYFVVDEENNIYWTSAKKRQHSKEINANPVVAATIVHDPESKRALQIIGSAYEVQLDEAEKADALYSKKYGDKERLKEVLENTPDGRAYWILKPDEIYFWDEVAFPDAPKQKI